MKGLGVVHAYGGPVGKRIARPTAPMAVASRPAAKLPK
jgi:hypothetical protein